MQTFFTFLIHSVIYTWDHSIAIYTNYYLFYKYVYFIVWICNNLFKFILMVTWPFVIVNYSSLIDKYLCKLFEFFLCYL